MTPAFEANDDVGMMLTASGLRTGMPSEYLIYTNVIIGNILRFMYTQVAGFNWYSFYLYSVHFLAMFVIFYSVLRIKFSWLTIFQYLLVFVFVEVSLLMNLQFTSTAFVIALSGLCLLITSLGFTGRKVWIYIACAALLIVMGGLVREEVVYLVLLLAVPFLLLKFWAARNWKIPAFLFLSLFLFFAFVQYNHYYYSKIPQWKEYFEYNKIRGQLHDYPKLAYNESTKPVFDKIGWSENDFWAFRFRLYFDLQIFSREKLEFINNNLKNHRSFQETLIVLSDSIIPNRLLIAFSICFLLLSITLVHKTQRKYIYSVILSAVLICIHLSYSARLPYRIFVPLLLFVSTMTMSINNNAPFVDKQSLQKRWIITIALSFIIICLLPIHVSVVNSWSKNNQNYQTNFKKWLQALPSENDKLYVVLGASLPWEFTSPYSDLKEYNHLNFLRSGWTVNSPFNDIILREYLVDDVYRSLLDNNDFFLIMREAPIFREKFSRYMLEHYGQKIRFNIVSGNERFIVCRVLKDT
jgi:hypothetical protein